MARSKKCHHAHEARTHLKTLHKLGMSKALLASISGVSERHIQEIMRGRYKYLTPRVHDALTTIIVSDSTKATAGKIKSAESTRLVAEMLEAGFSKSEICRMLGKRRKQGVGFHLEFSATIPISRAKEIRALHDHLWRENATGFTRRPSQNAISVIYGKPMREVCRCYGTSDLEQKRKADRIRHRDFRAKNTDEALYA